MLQWILSYKHRDLS